jgi:hypothetical protein
MGTPNSSETTQVGVIDEIVNHRKRIDARFAQLLIQGSAICIGGKNLCAVPTPRDVLALVSCQRFRGKSSLILNKSGVDPRGRANFAVHRHSPKANEPQPFNHHDANGAPLQPWTIAAFYRVTNQIKGSRPSRRRQMGRGVQYAVSGELLP